VTVSRQSESTNDFAYIYSMRPDGSDYSVLRQFPTIETMRLGQLIEASDGNFYVAADGRMLKISRSGEVSSLYEGALTPYSLMEGADGTLYGYDSRWHFLKINKDGGGLSTIGLWGREIYGKRMVEESPGRFLVVDENHLYTVDVANNEARERRSFQYPTTSTFGFVKGANNSIYGMTLRSGTMNLGSVFRLDEVAGVPQLAVTLGRATNVNLTTFGPAGTSFQIDSAPSPEGPWIGPIIGSYIQPSGTTIWQAISTNRFYRARLVEY
jgi:hypothetical protein